MKVVQINATYGTGSTGTIVKDIQNICLSNGIDAYVAYSYSNSLEDDIKNGYKIGNLLDRKIHAALSRINGMQGYFSHFETRKLLRWLNEVKPDIIHIHNLHNNYINVNMLLEWIAKKYIALVVTFHDCWFFTGGCTHYTQSGCNRWVSGCGNCPRKKQEFSSLLFDRSSKILSNRYKYFNMIDRLVAVGVSQWIAKEASRGVFRNKLCTHIYNGVDTSIFKPNHSDLRKRYELDDKFVILGPATKWLQSSNRALLVSTLLNIDSNSKLVLFGCSSSMINTPISSFGQGLTENISNRLLRIGYLPDKIEMSRLYSMADVFVNPTHEDSLPTINMEAQACGTPVICFSNTGAKETVNTEFGRLVETDDIEGVYSAISSVKAKPMKDIDIDKLISWVENNFNVIDNYNKYITLYKDLATNTLKK